MFSHTVKYVAVYLLFINTYSIAQDYPSPGFLKQKLIEEQVSPIFAINKTKVHVYEQYKVCVFKRLYPNFRY